MVLMLEDASGYDIRKLLVENFGHFMVVSSNVVYPALKKINSEGLVDYERIQQYPQARRCRAIAGPASGNRVAIA